MIDGYGFSDITVGGLQTPLSSFGNILNNADPVLANLLPFFAALLEIHMGDAFRAQIQATGSSNFDGYTVSRLITFDPAYYLTQASMSFPILAMYRMSSVYGPLDMGHARKTSTLGLDWVLPSLDFGEAERFMPFLPAAESIFLDRIAQQRDPSYLGGSNPFLASGCQKFKVLNSALQHLSPPSFTQVNANYPTLHFTFEVWELSQPNLSGLAPAQGADVQTDLIEPPDGYYQNVSSFKTEA